VKKALLLSAYDAQSHRYWREGLVEHFPCIHWTCLSLPPRYFNWRIRGNSLSWAVNNAETFKTRFDFIVASSTVDLSALIGMAPSLANIPSVLYYHDNQFDYPKSSHQNKSIEPKIVSLYAAVAATKIVFNSNYNRQTFLSGVDTLLKKLPDHTPKNLTKSLYDKSCVIPVPLKQEIFEFSGKHKAKNSTLEVIWNHRWEYDKGPDTLLAFFKKLSPSLQLKVHIVGQSFRHIPKAFERLKLLLKERKWLGQWGYLDSREEYFALLHQSDIVLSTALHDFQGLSILESVVAGCSPLVPDGLAYTELFASCERYERFSLVGEGRKVSSDQILDVDQNRVVEQEAQAAVMLFNKLYAKFQSEEPLPSLDMSHLSWSSLLLQYQKLFDCLD